ncbi:MAG: transcription antitermination factor NusB [Chitinophagaceae bacterium]|nr:transcription antitermination factor NusB [Chitinophagaceae bacterium]
MISRRIIRVKVMQTLYSLESQDSPISSSDAIKLLQKHFDLTRQLLVYVAHFITEVARYSETDARNKASKHLPSAMDLRVNTKIAGNELLWKILEHSSYTKAVKEDKPHLEDDSDLVKKIYQDLATSEKYHQYIITLSREKKTEKEILEYILTDLMLPNEQFTGFIEERFPNWDDDGEMVTQLLMSFLGKPHGFDFGELIGPDKWIFAKDLLRTTIEKKEVTMELIKPKLKNWDADRIAVLDMLLMRMGVCEFLYFETIPPKVTINEYIDLAKEYSTQQSGQFINGILDNIHKELVKDDKMHKVAFKSS